MESLASCVKVLVCGETEVNQLKKLLQRIEIVNKNNGPFAFSLISGLIGDESDIKKELSSFIDGEKQVSIPIYYLNSNGEQHGTFCSNFYSLGKQGIKEIEGIYIAYAAQNPDVQDLVKSLQNTSNIHILLTYEWPAKIYDGFLTNINGSDAISEIAAQAKPRYHFAANKKIYFERVPYTTMVDGKAHTTRFFGLATAFNPDKSQKYLYAMNVPIALEDDKAEFSHTPSPYIKQNKAEDAIPSKVPQHQPKKQKISHQDERFAGSWNVDKPKGFNRWGLESDQVESNNYRNDRKKGTKGKRAVDGSCWFCLSNPNLEKHLLINIGKTIYLALAKGPLVDEHIILVPIQHINSMNHLPSETHLELNVYKESLIRYANSKDCEVIFFERNQPVKNPINIHGHTQAVILPKEVVNRAEKAFLEEGQRLGVQFSKVARTEDVVNEFYFMVQLPNVVLVVNSNLQKLHIEFGRMVLAWLLGKSERSFWKDCVASEAHEKKIVQAFKANFKQFEPIVAE